jgi:cobalamin-dependent methionine synthase I
VSRGSIELQGGTRFKSPKLAKTLSRAESVCCFVATVGPALEMDVQRRMQQRRYADAYVLDAMGSMSAENIVEQFYRRTARKLAESGRGVTLRFSPGYCDWPLDQQHRLFALFADHAPLKVELSRSCLMSPRKSVSGLFGILPTGVPGAHPSYNPCSECKKRDCIARRSH